MKASISTLAEVGLGATVLLLAALLAVPSSPRRLPPLAAASPAGVPAATPAGTDAATAAPRPAPQTERVPVAIDAVAQLFGYRSPVPGTGKSGPAALVPSAGLAYLGSVTLEDGKQSWLFKDTRKNAVLSLQVGAASGGWRLLEANDRSLLLESGGQRYRVTF